MEVMKQLAPRRDPRPARPAERADAAGARGRAARARLPGHPGDDQPRRRRARADQGAPRRVLRVLAAAPPRGDGAERRGPAGRAAPEPARRRARGGPPAGDQDAPGQRARDRVGARPDPLARGRRARSPATTPSSSPSRTAAPCIGSASVWPGCSTSPAARRTRRHVRFDTSGGGALESAAGRTPDARRSRAPGVLSLAACHPTGAVREQQARLPHPRWAREAAGRARRSWSTSVARRSRPASTTPRSTGTWPRTPSTRTPRTSRPSSRAASRRWSRSSGTPS